MVWRLGACFKVCVTKSSYINDMFFSKHLLILTNAMNLQAAHAAMLQSEPKALQ